MASNITILAQDCRPTHHQVHRMTRNLALSSSLQEQQDDLTFAAVDVTDTVFMKEKIDPNTRLQQAIEDKGTSVGGKLKNST